MIQRNRSNWNNEAYSRFRRPPFWAALFATAATVAAASGGLSGSASVLAVYGAIFVWLHGLYLVNHAKGAIPGLVFAALIAGMGGVYVYYMGAFNVLGYTLAATYMPVYLLAVLLTEEYAKRGSSSNKASVYHRYLDALQKGRNYVTAFLGLCLALVSGVVAYALADGWGSIYELAAAVAAGSLTVLGLKQMAFSLKTGRVPWYLGGALKYRITGGAARRVRKANAQNRSADPYRAGMGDHFMSSDALYDDAGTMDLSETWS